MRKLITSLLAVCALAATAIPSYAMEYSIGVPDAYRFGAPTAVETVFTADDGKWANEDISKNSALIPPSFGSPAMDFLNTGAYLTPFLALGGNNIGQTGNGSVAEVSTTVTDTETPARNVPRLSIDSMRTIQIPVRFTDVTGDLYYGNGTLGTLSAPSIGLSVGIYQGTDSAAMAKGAGHFEESSIWDGNVALASHNRGSSSYFAQIHNLNAGDQLILSTKLGTRTYTVTGVSKVSETDRSALAAAGENRITLYTCVMDQPDYRWCVQGVEAG